MNEPLDMKSLVTLSIFVYFRRIDHFKTEFLNLKTNSFLSKKISCICTFSRDSYPFISEENVIDDDYDEKKINVIIRKSFSILHLCIEAERVLSLTVRKNNNINKYKKMTYTIILNY